MPPKNGPVHVECSIMRIVMKLATEAELGGLFENCQNSTSMQASLAKMGHPQPQTQVENENPAANIIMNKTEKN